MTISSNNSVKGFTMIELLMVLVIISVLAAMAIPLFSHFSESAQVDELKSIMLVGAAAQEKYFMKYGSYSPITTGDVRNYGFPQPDEKRIMLFSTGIYQNRGGEQLYWICGRRCVNGKSHNWLFLPSLTSSEAQTDSSNFIDLNKSDLHDDYDKLLVAPECYEECN